MLAGHHLNTLSQGSSLGSSLGSILGPSADACDAGLITGWGKTPCPLPEEEMATHSSILAWEILWTAWGATAKRVAELDTTEQLKEGPSCTCFLTCKMGCLFI